MVDYTSRAHSVKSGYRTPKCLVSVSLLSARLALGILLPLLFKEMRRPWPLIWRVAVISASIEIVHMSTNARAVDVDDVILNTTGAALAFGLFWVLARLLRRSGKAPNYSKPSGQVPIENRSCFRQFRSWSPP